MSAEPQMEEKAVYNPRYVVATWFLSVISLIYVVALRLTSSLLHESDATLRAWTIAGSASMGAVAVVGFMVQERYPDLQSADLLDRGVRMLWRRLRRPRPREGGTPRARVLALALLWLCFVFLATMALPAAGPHLYMIVGYQLVVLVSTYRWTRDERLPGSPGRRDASTDRSGGVGH